ncbi:DUF4052 family protein [Paenibacillus apis]|uniref:DUF4052 domain-containing protein n=1 Tax=Paenibacillus apis TaxID=1792174 RepID=A0A919Y6Y1_9BACL|nr:DUF4052 family protein [Paenibacillus apis]GIO43470.1 hypothetical protein J41TS4_32280 [Paenibacillus apis]
MASYRNTMRFMWKDSYKALRIFLAVLLLVDIGLLVFQVNWPHLVDNHSNNFYSSNYGAIGIFTLVSGLLTATVTFPLMLSLGSTRKNYIAGALSYGVLSSAGLALFQTLVAHGGTAILEGLGKLSESAPTPFLTLWYTQFTIYLLIFLLFTLLGTIFYRYGTVPGLITIAGFLFILFFTANAPGGTDYTDKDISSWGFLLAAHYLLALCVLVAALLWLIIRKAAVRTY